MPELLIKFGNWLFAGFIGISAFFLLSIESIFNGGFYFSASHLWLPLFVIIFGYTWRYRDRLYRATNSKVKTWGTAIILYPIALLMSWPYVMALNALTGSNEQITYNGPIQKKWISHGRSKGYHIEILDDSSKQIVTLNCSHEDYNNLSKGQIISKAFQVGGLGIPYRWRF